MKIEVLRAETLPAFLERARGAKVLALDTETTSVDALRAELVAVTFAFDAETTYYLDVPQGREEACELLGQLAPILQQANTLKVGQNLKYDLQVLRSYGVQVEGASLRHHDRPLSPLPRYASRLGRAGGQVPRV